MKKIISLLAAVSVLSGCSAMPAATDEEILEMIAKVNAAAAIELPETLESGGNIDDKEKMPVDCKWDMYEQLTNGELAAKMLNLCKQLYIAEISDYAIADMVNVNVDVNTREWYYNSSPQNTLICQSAPYGYTAMIYYQNDDNGDVTPDRKAQLASLFRDQITAALGEDGLMEKPGGDDGKFVFVYEGEYQFLFDISENGLMSAMCRVLA